MSRRLSIAIACLSLLALGTLAVPDAKAYRGSSYHRHYAYGRGYYYPGNWLPSYGYPPIGYAAPYSPSYGYPSYGWSRYYYPSYRSHYVPYHGRGRR